MHNYVDKIRITYVYYSIYGKIKLKELHAKRKK